MSLTWEVSNALTQSSREDHGRKVQPAVFDRMTRELFLAAGLRSGMRVLDVGCGTGDLSFLLSEMVGTTGQVIAVDRSAEALYHAEASARKRGLRNTFFLEGDPADMKFDFRFDAVVGRLVLMYYPNPAEALRKLARHVLPGGVVVFDELDAAGCQSSPPSPTYEWAIRLARRALEMAGVHTRLGTQLHSLFLDAGLPAPKMRVAGAVGGGPNSAVYSLMAEVVRGLLPVMERCGLVNPRQVEVDLLEEKIREELVANHGIVTSPLLIGAWTRVGQA